MQLLLGYSPAKEICKSETEYKAKKPFALPPRNGDMRRAFAYLLKQRHLDKDIVSYFVHQKLLYEEAEHHNLVFVGMDENDVPRHASLRGTSISSNFKGNVQGSQPEYSFHYTGADDKLYVFEAPIDMLSFITIQQDEFCKSGAAACRWKDSSYVALCSVAPQAAVWMLEQNLQIKNVYLCLDNDKAGIEATARLAERLSEFEGCEIHILQPQNKDWNEDLAQSKAEVNTQSAPVMSL